MTITLATNIGVAQRDITLSAPTDAIRGDLFRLEDEMVCFIRYQFPARGQAVNKAKARFDRGVNGSDRASHAAGTELLGVVDAFVSGDTPAPDPFVDEAGGPGSGAVDSVNGQTDVVVLDAADIAVDPTVAGAADVQAALEALEGAAVPGLAAVLLSENLTEGIRIQDNPAVDVVADVSAEAVATGTGNAFAEHKATTEDGSASVLRTATATGAGDSYSDASAITVDGNASAGSIAEASGTGNANADVAAHTTAGSGNASAQHAAAAGSGDANSDIGATSVSGNASATVAAQADGGTAQAGLSATHSANFAYILITADGSAALIKLAGLPTSDPAVAGALWVDPAADFVMKVSQG